MRVFLSAAVLFGCLAACPAGAKSGTVVGTATEIVRNVTGRLDETVVTLSLGDDVYRNQRIATARDSSALLTLADESLVAVGPLSEVVLDDFAAAETSRVVTVTQGIFRFVSGPFARPGTHYLVKTPHVAIAVRGTRFDVRVSAGMTTIVLNEGAVDLCRGGKCEAMAQGTTLDVTRYGIYPSRSLADPAWTFEAGSSSAARRVAAALETASAAPVREPASTQTVEGIGWALSEHPHDDRSTGASHAGGDATTSAAAAASTSGIGSVAGGSAAYDAKSSAPAGGAVARGSVP